MTHLRPEELSATLDGALEGEARERAKRHLAECASCRESLAALAEQDTQLRSVLAHDPGEAYFASFAARVEDRIRAAGLKGAQSRLGREGAWGWLSPRRLAWAGALAAVIGGAGIVMLTGREHRRMLENPEIARRTQGVQEAAPSLADRRTRDEKRVAPAQESKLDADARSTREQVRARAEDQAAAPQPAPAADPMLARGDANEAAAPARAQEVRRNAAGEDVPVSGRAAPFAAPPPTTPVPGGVAGAKPKAAPMELQSGSSTAQKLSVEKERDASTRLCGRVVDGRQRPVAGATVALADRGLVTNTGADGRFCFDAAAGLHELSVMAVGYEATRLQIRVEGESSEALVTLRPMSVLDGGTLNSTSPSSPLAKGSAPATSRDMLEAEAPSYSYLQQPASAKANTTLERAREAQRTAESLGTAAAYDAAASAWSKVVPLASVGAGQRDARYSMAAARYRAWQLGPNSSRAKSARGAIDAFLRTEPAGDRKAQASAWLRELPG